MASRHLLMVVFHLPPAQGSSGMHRTLSYARYLPEHDWEVTILSPTPSAYGLVREENLDLIPEGTAIHRSFALNLQKHLSLANRYPQFLAVPDRWNSWIPSAWMAGKKLLRQQKFDAIFSTYPVASAQFIGWLLQRSSGLPWVADFRDPMLGAGFPPLGKVRSAHEYIEGKVRSHASALTVTTEGTRRLYEKRFESQLPVFTIENGVDAQMLEGDSREISTPEDKGRRLRLLHSGLLYEQERNPVPFFKALAQLKQERKINSADCEFVFRASGFRDKYAAICTELDISDLVSFEKAIGYREALQEMREVDALMIFQAAMCNAQVPAKAYEYLYVRKPIIAFTDSAGDTAELLKTNGVDEIVDISEQAMIVQALPDYLDRLRKGQAPVCSTDTELLTRKNRTAQFAKVLDAVVGSTSS